MKSAAFLGLLSQITKPVVPELFQKAEKKENGKNKAAERGAKHWSKIGGPDCQNLTTALHSLDGEVAPSAEKYFG